MNPLALLCRWFPHKWRSKRGEAHKVCARCGAKREIKRRKV
jgi:hypothetical protein